jgi:prepilin-type N-terminal cleavage/methylation domain-containing protein
MRVSGFTLVELVCVIVILGCLGALAMPRYLNLSDAAARARVSQQAHAFSTAVQFVRIVYDLRHRSGAVDNLAGYGAGNVDTNANGYPTDTANANTIPNNGTGANRCRNVFGGLLAGAVNVCGGSVACNTSHDFQARTIAPQVCRFDYVEIPAPARFFTYNATDGSVVEVNP